MKFRILINISIVHSILQCSKNKPNLDLLKELQSLSDLNRTSKHGMVMKNILKPRVSGTVGNIEVRNYIIKAFKAIYWNIELDEFTDYTPIGNKQFTNIIVSNNPQAKNKLVFAAHFDSKILTSLNNQKEEFVGALDSAVSVALLIDLAYSLNSFLNSNRNNNLALELIFFDGEEAFKSWTPTDSLYGSRHLANKWSNTIIENSNNRLSSIKTFVLLDLLGAKDSKVYNINDFRVNSYFTQLYQIESMIIEAGYSKLNMQTRIIENYAITAEIEDDHLPFKKLNVSTMHLIPAQFPNDWHKITDNEQAISEEVTSHLALLFRSFVYHYMCENIY